jgi:hypothetical protein
VNGARNMRLPKAKAAPILKGDSLPYAAAGATKELPRLHPESHLERAMGDALGDPVAAMLVVSVSSVCISIVAFCAGCFAAHR